MLFQTSKEGLKTAFDYFTKIPFSKDILHKMSEIARGKCVVFFTLHRVVEDDSSLPEHPHLMNKTALTLKETRRLLIHFNRKLPFVSLVDSLEFLKGSKSLNRSVAVLVIEVPYANTIRLIKPLLEELRIPATIVVSTKSLFDGQMPWPDEIVYRLGSTAKKSLSVNFIDRSFSLNTTAERMAAAKHFIDHLSKVNLSTLRTRIDQLRQALPEIAIHPVSERISTLDQLEKLSLNPLFTFLCGGKYRLASLSDPEDALIEIVEAMTELRSLFNRSLVPVFFYHASLDKKKDQEIIKMMMDFGYLAAIGQKRGVCRPGDNMFRLRCLPLSLGTKSSEQFEAQGFFDALDEILMVTLAKEKEL